MNVQSRRICNQSRRDGANIASLRSPGAASAGRPDAVRISPVRRNGTRPASADRDPEIHRRAPQRNQGPARPRETGPSRQTSPAKAAAEEKRRQIDQTLQAIDLAERSAGKPTDWLALKMVIEVITGVLWKNKVKTTLNGAMLGLSQFAIDCSGNSRADCAVQRRTRCVAWLFCGATYDMLCGHCLKVPGFLL